ncbi:MAG: hypothetical protein IKY04_04040 [Lachnospiraceae bacterium]|nr:hypothetical protein [Lachnospiraceae bacterium]MBR4993401.1 hypothetical protein [Lachnospiraceae bacterium]
MNTIKNYLESMFANMPNTPAVLKAKTELWQMMEDKYNELIAEGKTENEAVGTVISEFGNLEDLADVLGLRSTFEQKAVDNTPRRNISREEALEYIKDRTTNGLMVGIATFICITCVCWPIVFDGFGHRGNAVGALGMFASIAIAVVLYVLSATRIRRWDFIKKVPCSLDYSTATELAGDREKYQVAHAVRITIGVLLCALCWLPAAIIDEFDTGIEALGSFVTPVILFVTVGVGVFLIILSNKIMNSYDNLLGTNDKSTVSGNYGTENEPVYMNSTIDTIMSVYWPTITCIYLAYSFLTFNWFSSWIIWPIAGIIHHVLKKNLTK